MSVKAKFWVQNIQDYDEGAKSVSLSACIDGSEENKEWSKYTPSGSIQMHISNPSAAEQFKIGDEFYLTFEKASKP